MDGVLWYVLASSRGGPTRVRILRALDERPRNANQLATELDYDYTTIRHHLDVLCENNVLRRTDEAYAAVYLFTDQVPGELEHRRGDLRDRRHGGVSMDEMWTRKIRPNRQWRSYERLA